MITKTMLKATTVAAAVAFGVTACGSAPAATGSGPNESAAVMPNGCGSGSGPVVLAVAGHANSPTPALSTAMGQAVATAAESGSPVGLVSIEGQPRLVRAGSFSSDAGNPAARTADRDNFLSAVTEQVSGLRATTPHADYLKASQISTDAVHAACRAGGTIYLSGSGLQDIGDLNFSASVDLLGAAPNDVVTFLRGRHELPNMQGVAVVLVGVGDTSAPQEPLDLASKSNLVAIWSAVLQAAGATVTVDPSPRGGNAPTGVPEVTPVVVPGAAGFPHSCSIADFRLPDTGPVGFLPDVPTFRDHPAADTAIRKIGTSLTACPGAKITLTGTTSSAGDTTFAGEDGRRTLSLQRAQAVKDMLAARPGIDASTITIAGNGYHFAGYENDRDAQGLLLPEPATRNRAVLVTVS
jgi:OmpA-OmpF porin, OOP family